MAITIVGTASPTANADALWLPAADACDSAYTPYGLWSTYESAHFTFHFLSPSAAEEHLDTIVETREHAYAMISEALELSTAPHVQVYLVPDRQAAQHYGLGMGVARPAEQRYDVVYNGMPEAFERLRPGHELSHVLTFQRLPPEHRPLPILDEGLAEFFDQSDRDLHAAYVQNITAGQESRAHLTRFDHGDVDGDNYGRAGSLAQLLIDHFGIDTALDIFVASALPIATPLPQTPEALRLHLAQAIQSVTDTRWEVLEQLWQTRLLTELDRTPGSLPNVETQAIAALIANVDTAIAMQDVEGYRATMESFYCEWGGESWRREVAARMTALPISSHSEIVAIYPGALKNFPTAEVLLIQRDPHGRARLQQWSVEKFPAGWRVSWNPDWR